MNDLHVYDDIVLGHRPRMLNVLKYYPFFMITKDGFGDFAAGRYENLDLGYLVMAVLRFFIEKNNVESRDVVYPEYVDFLKGVIARDFDQKLTDMEVKEVADFVFGKMRNDGRPFAFEYYDPADRKKRSVRIRMIESNIVESVVYYSIGKEALAFYLDTKEFKDESKINVEQLLLEKLITSKDFSGGIDVVKRINDEVLYLDKAREHVRLLLSSDVRSALLEYDTFKTYGMKWFLDEQKLFQKNMTLIRETLKRAKDMNADTDKVRSIYELELELNKAMHNHLRLLEECTVLSRDIDVAIQRKKVGSFVIGFDYERALDLLIEKDDMEACSLLSLPLLKPKIKKSFSFEYVKRMFDMEEKEEEKGEDISRKEAKETVYSDELEDERIRDNYKGLFGVLIALLKYKEEYDLVYFMDICKKLYSEEIVRNGDLYSFLVNLCQKDEYRADDKKADTFFDEIVDGTDYGDIGGVKLIKGDEQEVVTEDGYSVTNVIVRRIGYGE
ncbi:MAG: hypothetical protein K6F17_04800 [Lachnospiraceae bacterium]|nr:hypothetical protein [Lachnospiraceae bacterium]